MLVIVRAFNADGYHKDILHVSEQQVHSNDVRVKDPVRSTMTGLIGPGGRIDPADFPEMVSFEVVIRTS